MFVKEWSIGKHVSQNLHGKKDWNLDIKEGCPGHTDGKEKTDGRGRARIELVGIGERGRLGNSDGVIRCMNSIDHIKENAEAENSVGTKILSDE